MSYAKAQAHPELKIKTVFEVFESERPSLVAYRGPFDGFHATTVAVSKTCLVRFDCNKYSVMAKAVGLAPGVVLLREVRECAHGFNGAFDERVTVREYTTGYHELIERDARANGKGTGAKGIV